MSKKITARAFLIDKGLIEDNCKHFEITKSDGGVFSLVAILEEFLETQEKEIATRDLQLLIKYLSLRKIPHKHINKKMAKVCGDMVTFHDLERGFEMLSEGTLESFLLEVGKFDDDYLKILE